MLTLLDIATAALDALNLDDSPSRDFARRFAARRWRMLWDAHLWPSSLGVEPDMAPDADGLLLPAGASVALVVQASVAGTPVPEECEVARRLMSGDESAEPITWRHDGVQPDGAPRLRFSGLPPGATVSLVVKRPAPALAADTDRPTLPGADLALIAHTTADLYEWQQQFTLAAAKRAEAGALVDSMLAQVSAQSAHSPRIIPDFGNGGHGHW